MSDDAFKKATEANERHRKEFDKHFRLGLRELIANDPDVKNDPAATPEAIDELLDDLGLEEK